jgi:hypothetical protein
MSVKPFSAGHTLESLRDSDFDSCSALGEVVDNSIQANASSVRIHFTNLNRDQLKSVVFIDDGDGMTKETIQHCLRLGWSSRYNDRSGIGRFGVGMTLGAIHECRRVQVYSKAKNSDWYYTYLDLDEIERSDLQEMEWEIPTPIKLKPTLDDALEKYLPSDSGTVVVWSNYDRAADKPNVLIEQFRTWLGRTYRYFIWNESVVSNLPLRQTPLTIFLNGKEIKAIDPLYLRTEKTEFPDDLISKEFPEVTFDWPILDPKIASELGFDKSKIRIRLTLLPEEWRSYVGAGGSEDAKKRQIPENEGFSFVRHGREVGYDWIPHFKFASDDKDRFWGCEIHFEPCLDRSFHVKNIKRGAVPSTELKKAIAEKIGPWIRRQRETISDYWKKKHNEPENDEKQPVGGGSHIRSEKIAARAGVPDGKIAEGKDHEFEKATAAQAVSDNHKEEEARWIAKFSSQPFTIGERPWPGPTFVDIHFMGGSDALFYNTRHIFFEVLNNIKQEVKDGVNVEFNAERVTVLIDMLLIAYAKSESMLNPNDKLTALDLIDHLKSNWGQYLKTYMTTWQQEFDNDI